MKVIVTSLLPILSMTAEAAPHNFTITCDSINHWTDSRLKAPPLALDEKWSIRISSKTEDTENYFFTMSKTKGSAVVEGPFDVPVNLGFYPAGPIAGEISVSIPGDCSGGECGRLTLDHLNLTSNDPFIAYGWSLRPLTVSSAMEYRCQIQGVLF